MGGDKIGNVGRVQVFVPKKGGNAGSIQIIVPKQSSQGSASVFDTQNKKTQEEPKQVDQELLDVQKGLETPVNSETPKFQ